MHLALDLGLLGRRRVVRHAQGGARVVLIVDGEAPATGQGEGPTRQFVPPFGRQLAHGIKTARCAGVRAKASARAGVKPHAFT
jgi:hypothetical protein